MYTPSDRDIADFIRESNAIEGYTKDNFDGEWEASLFCVSHRHAAEAVIAAAKEGELLPVCMLHSILMRGLDDHTDISASDIGRYRTVSVEVGGRECAKPYTIDRLMNGWEQAVERWVVGPKGNIAPSERANVCWQFHHWFEVIHPFIDGNGRTGRLVLNNLRLLSGLDWHVVYAAKRQDYYAEIRRWQEEKWDSVRHHSLEV